MSNRMLFTAGQQKETDTKMKKKMFDIRRLCDFIKALETKYIAFFIVYLSTISKSLNNTINSQTPLASSSIHENHHDR